MTLADQIRECAISGYINPVRKKRTVAPAEVTITAGDLVRQLKLQQRVPAVCGALDAHKFLYENNLKLIQRSGPKHGPRATWKFLV